MPCSAPPSISYGSPSYSGTDHGSAVTYYCNVGYQIFRGSQRLTCSDGTWLGSTPLCVGNI
ncbi:hypothetical protein DPMN_194549 [Dreissena polymorpha]|uniref:Sushi domain-containing protein n=1 Tax=Dreissena polymorpha TaxID=45954 RepID=A0A9D4B856_DREPO|nr:hypothetical protein DPMN_194549 [Dreissena polymorpha]